ncbi:glutaminase, partial [Proteus mirabilis]|uniref:glutaminase n=1 Tax=Proteus mirabilis TaxID=584 RepID=UPI00311A9CFA
LYLLENAKILGLSELRRALMAAKKPFDYDREVEGLKALDRYTFQLKLGVGDPRFIYNFADAAAFGLAVVDVEGRAAVAGDGDVPFSIQSISKVFTLTLALGMAGDR